MAITATICQVYVSGSVGTEVLRAVGVVVPIGHENYFAQSIN